MAIWITQALCELRHTSCAVLWDDMEITRGEATLALREQMGVLRLRDHCGICGGGLVLDHGRTVFKTMEEAYAAAGPLQAAQLKTRFITDRLGLTKEKLN